jgi:hypothetical protein
VNQLILRYLSRFSFSLIGRTPLLPIPAVESF